MKKQIWTSLVAALVIAAGSARLATPAHAATPTGPCAFTVLDLIAVSDAICGGGNWSASNISCSGDTMSWDLTCS